MRARFTVLAVGCSLALCALVYALAVLQIRDTQMYANRALAQRGVAGQNNVVRGVISVVDREGQQIPLAMNHDQHIIFAVPKEIEDADEVASQLRALLAMPFPGIEKRLAQKTDLYEGLVVDATSDQVALIEEAGITGLYTTLRQGREYPFGSLASHVVGFVSQDEGTGSAEGQYGVEAFYNAELSTAGTSGELKGQDVTLTLDRSIQQKAEELIADLVREKKAIGGGIIVMEPATGRVLAMANEPTFNPNEYAKTDLGTFINPLVQGLYEPGSVFKPITMAIGLDLGVITPETTYNDPGYFTSDGKTIKNWDLKAHGLITMTNVIEQSINTGTVFAQRKIGQKPFYEYLLKFGMKELTGITLPGEITGRLTPLEKYPRDINFATAAYGQGVAVTPIRLITALGVLANGGMLVEPYIVEGAPRKEPRRVIGEHAAKQATQMMVSAVKKAKVADLANYTVAGKTGTAFKPDFKKGGYSDKVINTYIGFAPACSETSTPGCKPRFIALIKLDEPENAPLAGTTVVPAFHDLAEYILNYYTVAPDKVADH